MFWLFNNESNEYIFYQVFPFYKKYKDNTNPECLNYLYNFTNDTKDKNDNNYNQFNLKLYPNMTINYDIQIKDQYISYYDKNSLEQITFCKHDEFIKETDANNKLKLPMFLYKYIKTDNNKVPNILHKYLDFYYPNIVFDIYKLDENNLLIIETLNSNTKKYILSKNLDSKIIINQ